jgi:S-formylglutathione hydrolase FrmB
LYSKVFTFSAAFIIDNISGAKSGYKDMIADYDYYVRAFGDLDKLKNTPKDPLWCLDRAIEANDAPELYIACGKDDFLINENRKMKAEIEKRNVKLEYTETEGIHDWTFWRQQIEPAVAWCLNKNVGSA